MEQKIDELLAKDCYIIDFLPETVPFDCCWNYFQVEEYFLEEKNKEFPWKVTECLLKLNCYVDFVVVKEKECFVNPPPADLIKELNQCYKSNQGYMNILLENRESLLVCNSHFLHLELYAPSVSLQGLC